MAYDIAENLKKVQQRIEDACRRCGRTPESVRLIAVTKTVSPEQIEKALAAGARILGENYIQEASSKIATIGKRVEWHLIGHLQTNKAKRAVELFDLIHSVDSLHLAEAIEKAAAERNRIMPVLVQVNLSGETSKHGIDPQATTQLVRRIAQLPHLRVAGLMTIPPLSPKPEESRPYYSLLRRLRDEICAALPGIVTLSELSMGMSSDFEVAIEEGATLVRVGTAIFGPRQ